jgi:hypothetical protein
MVERFLETLIQDLEKSCMNKELNTHIVWTRADVDLDINKCRKHCRIDSGYVWNGILICESCTKILYGRLDRFNKSTLELAFKNYMIEDKMNNIIENMKTMQNHITNLTDKVNNLDSEIINNDISKDDIYNNIKNNSIILENTIKANDIKYTSMIQNFQKKIDDIYNEIDIMIAKKINNKLVDRQNND